MKAHTVSSTLDLDRWWFQACFKIVSSFQPVFNLTCAAASYAEDSAGARPLSMSPYYGTCTELPVEVEAGPLSRKMNSVDP